MPDMIKDKFVSETWVNAHTLTGINSANALVIQSKGVSPLLAMIKATSPEAGAMDGFRLPTNQIWSSAAGDVVWVRSESGVVSACIQDGS